MFVSDVGLKPDRLGRLIICFEDFEKETDLHLNVELGEQRFFLDAGEVILVDLLNIHLLNKGIEQVAILLEQVIYFADLPRAQLR